MNIIQFEESKLMKKDCRKVSCLIRATIITVSQWRKPVLKPQQRNRIALQQSQQSNSPRTSLPLQDRPIVSILFLGFLLKLRMLFGFIIPACIKRCFAIDFQFAVHILFFFFFLTIIFSLFYWGMGQGIKQYLIVFNAE